MAARDIMMPIPLTGRCQCGQVRYSVAAQPLFTYACHCSDCQKRTGSAFSMGLVVLTDSLQAQGELTSWSRTSDKGNTNTRYSCAGCGNIIYGVGDSNPELAKLQAGTLDDTQALEPELHIWTCKKQGWVSLPPRARTFDKEPESAAQWLQAAADFRAGS